MIHFLHHLQIARNGTTRFSLQGVSLQQPHSLGSFLSKAAHSLIQWKIQRASYQNRRKRIWYAADLNYRKLHRPNLDLIRSARTHLLAAPCLAELSRLCLKEEDALRHLSRLRLKARPTEWWCYRYVNVPFLAFVTFTQSANISI
jgi:hypothetical protein